MRSSVQQRADSHSERGAVLVLVAISMVAFLGVAAMAVDLGYFMVTRNEVQNIADGSALAGARALGDIYQGLSSSEQQSYYCDEVSCQTVVRGVAQDVASKNRAGGLDMTVRVEDILIGQWKDGTFTETYSQPDAVYVIARRDTLANGPITTSFARVLGIDQGSVNAQAIAAMTGQGVVAEGELGVPVALSSWFFEGTSDRCNDYIRFSPANSPESCGGWTYWHYGRGTPTLRDILDGTKENLEIKANQTRIAMDGGDVAAAFSNMLELFKREGFATDATSERKYLLDGHGNRVKWDAVEDHPDREPWLEWDNGKKKWVHAEYPDGTPRFYHKWETTVPVYDHEGDECANPNQSKLVVGFAPVVITDVIEPNGPVKQEITGKVDCRRISPEPNRGGGGDFGLKGPIPGLVR